MTPLQIEMILHFHCINEPWPRLDAPACRDAIDGFIKDGVVNACFDRSVITLTDRGRAYVHFLCAVPLPNASWAIPGPLASAISQEALP